jgi:hypothetical protein
MNLLMEEDLDITEEAEISLVEQLDELQWAALLPRLHARIVLRTENQQAIIAVKADNIPFCNLDSLDTKQFI